MVSGETAVERHSRYRGEYGTYIEIKFETSARGSCFDDDVNNFSELSFSGTVFGINIDGEKFASIDRLNRRSIAKLATGSLLAQSAK